MHDFKGIAMLRVPPSRRRTCPCVNRNGGLTPAATAGWRSSTASSNWRRLSKRNDAAMHGGVAKRANKSSRGRYGRGWRRCGRLGGITGMRVIEGGQHAAS
jgi:hypothetical protein